METLACIKEEYQDHAEATENHAEEENMDQIEEEKKKKISIRGVTASSRYLVSCFLYTLVTY
jgi:hypothetical protein